MTTKALLSLSILSILPAGLPGLALASTFASLQSNIILNVLMAVLVLSISLSFHEAAHAWAAYRLGDDTAALQGRLTMNPLAHLDPVGSLVFIISSVAGRGIGWAKPVPINPARFSHRFSMKTGILLSSLAGPSANLVLAVIAALLLNVLNTIFMALAMSNVVTVTLLYFFLILYGSNVMLAIFNLLPVPPLDGFKIFGAILPDRLYNRVLQYERYIGLVFLALVLFGGNLLSIVLGAIFSPINSLIYNPIAWLFARLQAALGLG